MAEAERSTAAVGGVMPGEREALLAWLGDGLRPGAAGGLPAEQPLALAPERIGDHVVARVDGRLAAHALGTLGWACAAGRRVAVGRIGLVYTDPAFRGRGLARACVTAAGARLVAGGARLLALWSDLDRLYAPLGYRRAGRESIHPIDPALCAAARLDGAWEVGPPRADEWPLLEALHERHGSRVERPPGALARLAAVPGCTTRVARRTGRALAWASAGRGADLRDVVHDWAGEDDGVLACLEALASAGARQFHAGPGPGGPGARLRAAGAAALAGDLALLAVPDPPALWNLLVAGDPGLAGVALLAADDGYALRGAGGAVPLAYEQALALLLGPERPVTAARALDAGQWLALRARLPWPLYFWGFDSI